MQNQVETLHTFIKSRFRNKDAFAKAIGMTRQNLNRIERMAKDRNGRFEDDFIARLRGYKIDALDLIPNPTNDFGEFMVGEESVPLLNPYWANKMKYLEEFIDLQKKTILSLEDEISKLKQPVMMKEKPAAATS